jgi:peptidoglycan/xylan/chitin deacetylase (PgdA/CDA1 family)
MGQAAISVPPYLTRLQPFAPAFARGVPILMYHKLGRPVPGAKIRGLYISQPLFARQLDDFAALGVEAVNVADTLTEQPDKRRAVITFDDAYRSVFELGLPLLAQHKLSATIYVVAGLVGANNAWDVAKGHPDEPLMSETELREWLRAGHRIGSHSLTHPHLTRIGEREAREEISASKKQLEDRFGVEVTDFCYPYGDHNTQVRDLVEHAGYRTATTTVFGLAKPDSDPFRLSRILVRHRSFAPRNLFRRATLD